MSNVLAALFGGLGAGASSYGTQRIREQDQERLAQQRMAELQQQEQARLSQVKEAAAAQQALRQQQREAGVNSLRVLFPDQPIPEGDFDADVVMRGRMLDAQNKRFEQGQTGQMERLEKSLGGRLDQIERQGAISQSIAGANNNTRMAIAALAEQGRNQRDNGQPDQQGAWVQRRVTDLLKPDDFGRTASIEEATAQARREAGVLFGGGPTSAPTRAPQQSSITRGNEMQFMNDARDAIAEINAMNVSPQEKQSMIQRVNQMLARDIERVRKGLPTP